MLRSIPTGLVLLALLTSCFQLGPQAVQASRTAYNQTLQATEDEQLLLNLVRLRYRDRVLFLELTSLSSQFSFERSAGASITIVPDVDEQIGINGRAVFEEKPTLTYRPLQGQDFVQRLLTRIPLDTLFLLDESGWSTERVIRTCVQQLGGLHNARRADGPTPAGAPEFERFQRASSLLRELELDGLLRAGSVGQGEGALLFAAESGEREEFRELTELLGLDPERNRVRVTPAVDAFDGSELEVQTRSLASVMYFLSHSVEIPEEDRAAGRVTVTIDDEGREFDWSEVTRGLMRIRSSPRRPLNAAVSVFHRGSWFYIDDSDLDSKSTFSLLAQLFALQSGASQGLAPLLTLPLGG